MQLVHRAGRDYCVVSNTVWDALRTRFTVDAFSGITRESRASSKDGDPRAYLEGVACQFAAQFSFPSSLHLLC